MGSVELKYSLDDYGYHNNTINCLLLQSDISVEVHLPLRSFSTSVAFSCHYAPNLRNVEGTNCSCFVHPFVCHTFSLRDEGYLLGY